MRANQFAAIEFSAWTTQQMIRRENRDHSGGSGFEGECDHDGGNEQDKRYRVVPSHFFLQEGDGEDDENRHGNRLLNDLQLKTGKGAETQAIGGYREAVFQQRNQPRYE